MLGNVSFPTAARDILLKCKYNYVSLLFWKKWFTSSLSPIYWLRARNMDQRLCGSLATFIDSLQLIHLHMASVQASQLVDSTWTGFSFYSSVSAHTFLSAWDVLLSFYPWIPSYETENSFQKLPPSRSLPSPLALRCSYVIFCTSTHGTQSSLAFITFSSFLDNPHLPTR